VGYGVTFVILNFLESTELATVVIMHTTYATLSYKINYANPSKENAYSFVKENLK
jgi:hypothetical protein